MQAGGVLVARYDRLVFWQLAGQKGARLHKSTFAFAGEPSSRPWSSTSPPQLILLSSMRTAHCIPGSTGELPPTTRAIAHLILVPLHACRLRAPACGSGSEAFVRAVVP